MQLGPMVALWVSCFLGLIGFGHAFMGPALGGQVLAKSCKSSTTTRMAVIEIGTEKELDNVIKKAGDGLVVVDYSTTWCGPCKVILPKYEALSEEYTQAVFLKVIGDSTPAATKLMKREGVRSVPAFHFWKDGKKVDMVNGANTEALETALRDCL